MLTDGGLTYTYDKNSNRTSVTYPGSLKATYTFDRMDREQSLTMQEGANPVVTLVNSGAAYKAYGPLTSLTHPTTTARTVTRNFDLRYAPTSIVVSGNLLTWNYTVDLAGNPTAISQTLPTAVSRNYGYQDWQYYLTSGAGPWSGPLSWTYDKIGNRLTETRGALTDDYDYLANSGLTGNTAVLDLVNLGVGGTRDYTFDAGGFLDLVDAGANQVDFTFDEAGQLAEVERAVAGEQLTHRYDGRGYLCESTDLVTGGYVRPTYSSAGVVMSLLRLPASAGTSERHNYIYFGGQLVLLWKKPGSGAATWQFLTTDHLGAPALAFNSAGASTWVGGLEPYGRDWQEGTGNDMLVKGIQSRLPGQWDDPLFNGAVLGSRIYYNLHRWYETGTGRYTRPDPFDRTALQNTFSYARSSPLRFVDPLGLFEIDPSCDCPPTPLQPDSVPKAIAQARNYFNSPGCQKILDQYPGTKDCLGPRFGPEELGRGPKIVCQKNLDRHLPPCGDYTSSSSSDPGTIRLFPGHSECPRFIPTQGLGQTLFHETVHSCGFRTKEDDPVFKAIVTSCTGAL